jgi:hypothetical protein
LDGKIADREVFARNITNDDLSRQDELNDELAELRLERERLVGRDVLNENGIVKEHVPGEVDEEEDPEARRQMRQQARELAQRIRDLEAQALGIYIEDEAGEPFEEEVLRAQPVRTLTRLTLSAAKYIWGDEEERPTTGRAG